MWWEWAVVAAAVVSSLLYLARICLGRSRGKSSCHPPPPPQKTPADFRGRFRKAE